MLFAAGLGTRMKPLTETIPKALIPFHGKPFLEHILGLLPPIDALAVNTHYLPEQIKRYFGRNQQPYPVRIFHEPTILGTGGGLQNAREELFGSPFLVWNCDILCGFDFAAFLRRFDPSAADVVLFCNSRKEASYLMFDTTGQLTGKTNAAPQLSGQSQTKAFCGISYFTRTGSEIFFESGYRDFSIVDSWLKMAAAGARIRLYDIGPAAWLDLGTYEQYLVWEKNKKMPAGLFD